MKRLTIILIVLVPILVIGQNKYDGKLYISLENISTFIKESKSGNPHFLYIIQKGEVVKEVDIDSLLVSSPPLNNRCSFMLSPATYSVVIEGYLGYPILFSDVVIRKKKSHFIILNIEKFKKINVSNPKILMLDYQKSLDENLKLYYQQGTKKE